MPFVDGRHLRMMGDIFNDIVAGKLKRVIINMPPRSSKSENASIYFPAYYLGKFPYRQVIQASNVADLAVGFGRQVRDLIRTPSYQELFPGLQIKADSSAAGRWDTNKGGRYYAVGAEGNITGRGGHLVIVDDPHCLHIDTPIPTPRGFVSMGDLRVGDYVYGPDGKPTRIIEKSGLKELELYRVTTSDGAYVDCDADHIWTVKRRGGWGGVYRNHTTRELLEQADDYAFMLPEHDAVEYPEAVLPIDPWALGAWLGDGTSSCGKISIDLKDNSFFRGEYEALGYEVTDQKDPHNLYVKGLMVQLRELGVLNNKHIPAPYFTASPAQRLALVQGLIDTDGDVAESGAVSFNNKNKELVEGVVELVRSLGYKASIISVFQSGGHGAGNTYYRTTFRMPNAARLPRKAERTAEPSRKARSITVTPLGEFGLVQCIRVDRPDNLFMAGRGYIVTHNTDEQIKLGHVNPAIYDSTFNWYVGTLRQRLMPGGAILVVQSRFAKRDLTGRILQHAAENGTLDEWKVIEFPVILPSGNLLWPEFWSMQEVESIKQDIPPSKFSSQYLQKPSEDEGAIIKKEWWRPWEGKMPEFEFIIQSWDTAFSAKTTANYSACTTWGVFKHHNVKDGKAELHAMLIHAHRDRMEFPTLKKMAKELYDRFHPDSILIEEKATGRPLIFELQQMNIPISTFIPTRGNDKLTRVNAVSDLFSSKKIWYIPNNMTETVIDEFTDFPSGAYDDLVDSSTAALLRFRQGLFIETDNDSFDDEDDFEYNDKSYGYY